LNYPLYQRFADRLLAKLTPFACAIVVSEAVKEECLRNRAIHPNKIIILPNGIPLEHFKQLSHAECQALKRHWDIPVNSQIVGTITRFHEEKGNRYLLEAAVEVLKVFPNTRFILAGDGPLLGQLKEFARQLEIERNAVFTGFQTDVVGILSLFDIMVIASTAEGHPQALLEAMAMGKAVVATEVGGIKEILIDKKTGVLVPPRDPHALAEQITFLLRNSMTKAHLEAEANKKSRSYSLAVHVEDLERVYKKLVGDSVA
jgi:glycosyltransferase involved in cell wall biosynthesis